MKKDFIVRRSITMIDGKPHVETYSEQELVRCKDCAKQCTDNCLLYWNDINTPDNWYCADGVKR